MKRIAPCTSNLSIANADSSDERKLLDKYSTFDYHASFLANGEWIVLPLNATGEPIQ